MAIFMIFGRVPEGRGEEGAGKVEKPPSVLVIRKCKMQIVARQSTPFESFYFV